MEDWKKRLLLEHVELETKAEKLKSFLNDEKYKNKRDGLGAENFNLLQAQLASMIAYLVIMQIRLTKAGVKFGQ